MNPDGLNRVRELGVPLGVGAYASDLDAEIMLIAAGEFDGNAARLGDVNYNSPAPYLGVKQKYVAVVTDIDNRLPGYGAWPGDLEAEPQRHGPNEVYGLGQATEGDNIIQAGHPDFGKKAAIIPLGNIRTDIAFIDGDGSASKLGGPTPPAMLRRGNGGLAANALRDPDRHVVINNTAYSMFYFVAADKVRWNDRNGDQHWDRGDELWIDVNMDGKYSAGDKVIFDYDNNLQLNTVGIAIDGQSELRYVRNPFKNEPASYTDGDLIFTSYFNVALYTASRDQILAHEALGHPAELPHTKDLQNQSIMYSERAGISYSANGVLVKSPTGGDTYIAPPTTFKKSDQDKELQLREGT